ncbi:MAG: hypothetical protein RR575_01150 [Acinetobacter sp.]
MLRKIILGMLVFCFILSGAYIAWLQKEVKLNQAVVNILKLVPVYDPNVQQPAFFHANGFDALADVNPSVLGKERYDLDWKLYLANPDTQKNSQTFSEIIVQQIDYKNFWSKEDKKLIAEIQGHLNSADYIETPFWDENKTRIETILKQKQFLLNRYQQQIHYQNYQALIQTPTANVPYTLYFDTHILFLADLYLQGSTDDVLAYIHLKLDRLNHNLNSVDKALVIVQLNQAIDVLNILAQRQSKQMQLPQLNAEQLSFEKQAAYEMRNAYYVFKNIDDRLKRASDQTTGLAKLWGKIYTPFAFDFNHSMNQAYLNYQPYIEVSKLPYPEFSVKINQIQLAKQRKWALSNNIGNILNQVGRLNRVDDILQPRLLDNKIQVFNIVNSKQNLDMLINNKSKESYVFIRNKNQLCIENPFKNRQQLKERLQQDSCVYLYSQS